jgi:nitroreductase
MNGTPEYESLLKLCRARRSCRAFAAKPVQRADVERIVALASASPYASGSKSWEIIAVDDKAKISAMAQAIRSRCATLSAALDGDYKKEFEDYSRFFSAFESAPVVLLPAFREKKILSLLLAKPELAAYERENSVKSISCAAMLALLAAESLGLAACYMTGPLLAAEEIGQIVGLRPGREIAAVIPLGYKG